MGIEAAALGPGLIAAWTLIYLALLSIPFALSYVLARRARSKLYSELDYLDTDKDQALRVRVFGTQIEDSKHGDDELYQFKFHHPQIGKSHRFGYLAVVSVVVFTALLTLQHGVRDYRQSFGDMADAIFNLSLILFGLMILSTSLKSVKEDFRKSIFLGVQLEEE